MACADCGGGSPAHSVATAAPASDGTEGALPGVESLTHRITRSVHPPYWLDMLLFERGSAAKRVGCAGTLKVEGRLSADRTQVDAQRIRFDH